MEHALSLAVISDDDLLRRLGELVGQARRVEADLVAHIGEVDERRLYAREASPSMFAYCTQVLHLSEAEAYLRITAARAARKHPMLLTLLRGGQLHLSGIALIAPHLTKDNPEALLKRASYKSKRQIEELIAEIAPRPDVPSVMQRLPNRRALPTPMLELRPDRAVRPAGELRPDRALSPQPATVALPRAVPSRKPVVQAWAPARYKVQFTATATLHHKLERLQALIAPRKCLTATWPRSSSKPSARSSSGSRPGALARRPLPGKGFARPTPPPPRAIFRPRYDER